MTLWIALFVAVDIVVMLAVAGAIMKKRFPGASSPGDFSRVRDFAESCDGMIGDYLSANYGGDPTTLPEVLGSLLDQLQSQASTQGVTVDRQILKSVILTSVAKHRAGDANRMRAVLAKVA